MFEDREVILAESNGNFWLAQYICNKICATNNVHETADPVQVIEFKLANIRQRLMAELSNNFMGTAATFSKGKKWRPGGNKPYLEIFLGLCRVPELVVPFDSLLSVVPERRRPGIKAVRPRIKEVLHNPSKSIDLRKQLAFEDDYFSIEDPLFRYFLNNVPEDEILRELGVKREELEADSIYPFEIGFSFAGEVRELVEDVNEALKQEDILTFYDFDQQAVLLAEDLEMLLPRIYSQSCRYYVVFLERHYLEKVWTRFERDIMTRAGRTRHIIPVVLDSAVHGNVVGISSTIGMVDLSKEWSAYAAGEIRRGDLAIIARSRLVDLLVEKVSQKAEAV